MASAASIADATVRGQVTFRATGTAAATTSSVSSGSKTAVAENVWARKLK